MNFLPDVYVVCEVCNGKRYNRETLEIKYRTKSIADILDMSVLDALEFFNKIPKVKRKLKTLCDVGLGYILLGQQATTLSGGEAQRIKLATELSKVSTSKTLYIFKRTPNHTCFLPSRASNGLFSSASCRKGKLYDIQSCL